MAAGEPVHETDTIHTTRHHHIRQDQVDRAEVGLDGRVGTVDQHDPGVERGQQRRDGFRHHRVILDAQDARACQRLCGDIGHVGRGSLARLGLAGAARQQDAHCRAAPFAPDEGQAMALAGEAMDLGQAQARPLADRLGREEGFEGLARGRFGHAFSIVGQGNANVVAGQVLAFRPRRVG